METTHYVCGFLFNPTWERVLLIRKQKPQWQKGKLNGVGGKIEPGETPRVAMKREFLEEAGLAIDSWKFVDTETGPDWIVDFFVARSAFFEDAIAMTEEQLERYSVNDLPTDVIENLKWLIPHAVTVGKGWQSVEKNG